MRKGSLTATVEIGSLSFDRILLKTSSYLPVSFLPASPTWLEQLESWLIFRLTIV